MTVDDKGAPLPSSDHLPPKRIVLFMDILGFRDLITRMSKEPHLYSCMRDLLGTIQQEIQNHNKIYASKLYPGEDSQLVSHVTQFSDSVVLSFPFYPETCDSAAISTVQFAQKLLERLIVSDMGVFARGGIACDWMYHDQNVLLGAGIVAAYELESGVARVPRIVVADEVANMLPDYECEQCLRKDSDGIWFVHPFLWFLGGLSKKDIQDNVIFQSEVIERSKKTREHIQKGLEQAKSKGPDLLAKYRWLANQFNTAVKEIFQGINISVDTIEVSYRP